MPIAKNKSNQTPGVILFDKGEQFTELLDIRMIKFKNST